MMTDVYVAILAQATAHQRTPPARPACKEYDCATCNLSFTSHFSSFELWSFYLDHSELGIMLSGIPTITFEPSVRVCQLCQLISARVLE